MTPPAGRLEWTTLSRDAIRAQYIVRRLCLKASIHNCVFQLSLACLLSVPVAAADTASNTAAAGAPREPLISKGASPGPRGGSNSLDLIQALLADESRSLTWVFTGDSITHGAKHTHGSRSYVEHFAERVRYELGRGQDVVINTGLSGDKADGLLQHFESRVARFKPDVVSIMIGMNDCMRGLDKREEFRNNLRQLVTRTRALGAVPMLHTQNTVEPSAAKERGDLPAYARLVAEVARKACGPKSSIAMPSRLQ